MLGALLAVIFGLAAPCLITCLLGLLSLFMLRAGSALVACHGRGSLGTQLWFGLLRRPIKVQRD